MKQSSARRKKSRTLIFVSAALLVFLFPELSDAAITRITRGTNSSKSVSTTLTITGVTIGTTGSSLIVGAGCTGNSHSIPVSSTVSWGAVNLSLDQGIGSGTSGTRAELWSAHNLTAGTATVTYTVSPTQCDALSLFAIELTQGNGPLTSDTSATGSATSTSVTTTSCGTLSGSACSSGSVTCAPNTSASCAWLSAVSIVRPNTESMSYTRPSNTGQKIGTSGGSTASNNTTLEGYEIDGTSVSQTASASWTNSAVGNIVLVTYKEPAGGGGGGPPKQLMTLGVGEK